MFLFIISTNKEYAEWPAPRQNNKKRENAAGHVTDLQPSFNNTPTQAIMHVYQIMKTTIIYTKKYWKIIWTYPLCRLWPPPRQLPRLPPPRPPPRLFPDQLPPPPRLYLMKNFNVRHTFSLQGHYFEFIFWKTTKRFLVVNFLLWKILWVMNEMDYSGCIWRYYIYMALC